MTVTVQQLFTRPALTFETPVPRSLVHRHAIAEVFLTDSFRAERRNHFVLGAQWPRRHAYFTDRRDGWATHGIALFAETLRQTAIYLAHRYFDVPLDAHFVMSEMNIEFTVGGTPAADTDVVIEAELSDEHYRDESLTRYVVDLTFVVDGRVVATGRGAAQVLPTAVYDRLRRTASTWAGVPYAPDAGVAPDVAGRDAQHDVVIAAGADGLELSVDPEHHIFFDHPCDHVPGMLILEAVVQSGRVLLGLPDALAVSVHATFTKFGELNRPVRVTAPSAIDDRCAAIAFEQDGVEIASGTVVFAP